MEIQVLQFSGGCISPYQTLGEGGNTWYTKIIGAEELFTQKKFRPSYFMCENSFKTRKERTNLLGHDSKQETNFMKQAVLAPSPFSHPPLPPLIFTLALFPCLNCHVVHTELLGRCVGKIKLATCYNIISSQFIGMKVKHVTTRYFTG